MQKTHSDRRMKESRHIGLREILGYSRFVFGFPFLLIPILLTSRQQTAEPIFTLFDSKDVNPRHCIHREINLLKLSIMPSVYPQKFPKEE